MIEPITRKIFICNYCEGIYADIPVTQCDCMEANEEAAQL